MKIGVKLLITLVVAVNVWKQQRGNRDAATTRTIHAIGGLALINVLVATLWQ